MQPDQVNDTQKRNIQPDSVQSKQAKGKKREKVNCQVKHIKIELIILRLVFLVKGHTKKRNEESSKRTLAVNKYTAQKSGSIPAQSQMRCFR